jgi:pyruvate kinase
MRRTKIIATVGPRCDSDTLLDALIAAGADIFRLNFSHGTHDSHAATFARVRAAAARAGREIAILQDLSGPKIRTGLLADHAPIRLEPGGALRIATGDFVGGPGRVSTSFEGLAHNVKPGDRLLLSDGMIELRVESTDGAEIQTTVVEGGMLGEHKGINAPGVPLPTSAITPKDVDDLRFGLALGVDMVAVSFVQTAADLRRARHLMIEANAADVPLMAKLERPQALEALDEILAACDAVMVARGDLGLEMPLERVPRAQKDITRAARRRGIPVVVATQVLESMMVEARPTRAEVNDAANAVDDGVDAIMLAGETAAGAHPVGAVRVLDAIIRDAESTEVRFSSASEMVATVRVPSPLLRMPVVPGTADDHQDALCRAAVTLAADGHAEAIIAVTQAGLTVRRLAPLRPCAPVVAITAQPEMARRMAINWGVVPLCLDIGDDVDASGSPLRDALVARGLVATGATVVLIRIHHDLDKTDANYLKIRRL